MSAAVDDWLVEGGPGLAGLAQPRLRQQASEDPLRTNQAAMNEG
jgi:hypothetical protein